MLSFPELTQGTLIKRYKRFLADIKLDDGRVITAHCPNSGSMLTCSEPGKTVYISRHDNPKRKYPYSWELIDMSSSLVGVNTIVPNKLIRHAISTGYLTSFSGYSDIKAEPRLESGSRLDLRLTDDKGNQCFIEIKNCTLVQDDVASFPDAVTSRGLKHLGELRKLMDKKTRCAMVFLIQRMDATVFRPAYQIDPEYSNALKESVRGGVEIHAYDVKIDLKGISVNKPVSIDL